MSAIAVAKKDFRDAVRSRSLIVVTALFALFTGSGAFLASWAGDVLDVGDEQTTLDLLIALQTPASFLVPIIALLLGYGAIAGERERGSLKFLLGLPHTRRDVVLGKVLGRGSVVAVSILIGFAVGMVAIFAFTGSVSPVEYVAFVLVTILFGFVYVCIGVGISAMTRSTTRAAVGAFGLLGVFWLLWGFIGQLALYVSTGSLIVQPLPEWYVTFVSLPPGPAYGSASSAILGESPLNELAGADELIAGGDPIATEPWVGFTLLAAWALVPLVLGLLRFDRADL
ncbi:ABC transporter permease [Halosolutus gelatinilyticus]|uniref:ABC transporter permease n=1 Tax=Halosolutus gelatinilyticus TaxID=2931975 RepID=UPI001FF1250D|nr:ABC transporter permease [Halosolutus gelatinilyticus]